jgi:carboxypeptidase T
MNRNKILWFTCILTPLLLLQTGGLGEHLFQETDDIQEPNVAMSSLAAFPKALVRISLSNRPSLPLDDLDIVGQQPGTSIDVILPYSELPLLIKTNVTYSLLIADVDQYSRSVARYYHSLEEMEELLHSLAAANPDITHLFSIGKSVEGRDIWCLEITDNPGVDEGEPGVFYMGLHHAREWPSMEICLYIAERLLAEYTQNAEIHDLLENRRLWIVPCVNPDGYFYCHDHGRDWRKNRHYFAESETYGVDLNRNYCGSTNGDPLGIWGTVGMSHQPSSEVYCGPSCQSEPETQAICSMFQQYDICACITYHTYGELVLWPWGYSWDMQPPDDEYMAEVGREIASRITRQEDTGTYFPKQAAGLYGTTGDTTDWAYGYGHYIQGRPTFAYTIEACSSFHPSGVLDQVCMENYDGALYLLEEVAKIKETVIPRVLPPQIDTMTTDLDGTYQVQWTEQNPDAQASMFQVDELSGLTLKTDKGDSGDGLWDLDGFVTSETHSHSPSRSFQSKPMSKPYATMTTTYPLPITEETMLSFWCLYDTYKDANYAYVEISRDNISYEVLESFSGTSDNWTYHEYSLAPYAGESLYIRFRTTNEIFSTNSNFYVDDITPIPQFTTLDTLSESITGTHFDIIGKMEGTYYYRVRGYNTEHGWGTFSTLEDIRVGTASSNPPALPTIKGPQRSTAGTNVTYTFRSTDPEGDPIFYFIDWGDGQSEAWVGPYLSGEEVSFDHTWNTSGRYIIKVKAKDNHDAESDWASFSLRIPRSQTRFHTFISILQGYHTSEKPFVLLLKYLRNEVL